MVVLITGATSGFGEATAIKFAIQHSKESDFKLILTGRRADRLESLKKKLVGEYGVQVHTLHFDIRSRKATLESIAGLPSEWREIDILINNAGLAVGFSSIDEGSLDDWENMIDTNVKGLLYMSHAVIPVMKARKKGHIINLGSTAAKDVIPNANIYSLTKHAVDAASQAMRIDLLPYHIKVTAIHPGSAETEFSVVRFKGDAQRAKGVYSGFKPLTAADIADIIYYTTTLPDHVCINDLVVTCTQQANSIYFNKDSVK